MKSDMKFALGLTAAAGVWYLIADARAKALRDAQSPTIGGGYSNHAIQKNIQREIQAGRDPRQAVALSYSQARDAALNAGNIQRYRELLNKGDDFTQLLMVGGWFDSWYALWTQNRWHGPRKLSKPAADNWFFDALEASKFVPLSSNQLYEWTGKAWKRVR